MQCNNNSFIQLINFHGLFCNALRCRKTGACRIPVPLRYLPGDTIRHRFHEVRALHALRHAARPLRENGNKLIDTTITSTVIPWVPFHEALKEVGLRLDTVKH